MDIFQLMKEISRKIDKIDRELLVLLQERMGLSLRSKKFQEAVGESANEADMLERMERMNLDLIKRSFSRQLLKTIVEESKRLQDEDRRLFPRPRSSVRCAHRAGPPASGRNRPPDHPQ